MCLLFTSLVLIGGCTQADLSASITAATEYELTGISQSAEEPVLQLGLHYQWPGGFYTGTWIGSGIDFGCCNADVEVDYYLGYYHQTDADWWWDISLNKYTYPGSIGIDYTETALQAGIDNWSARFGWSGSFLATGERGFSAELEYTQPLAREWSLVLHVGRTGGAALSRATIGFPDYSDYAIGLVYENAPFSAEVRWVDTSLEGQDRIDSGVLRNTGRWVFSITWNL